MAAAARSSGALAAAGLEDSDDEAPVPQGEKATALAAAGLEDSDDEAPVPQGGKATAMAAAGLEDSDDEAPVPQGEKATAMAAAGLEDSDDEGAAAPAPVSAQGKGAAAHEAAKAAPGLEKSMPLFPDQTHVAPDTLQVLYKTNNIIGVAPYAFNPSTHETEATTFTDERNKTRVILNNVMRWRYDGANQKQSNTRLIRWSDGTLHLQVGGEVFNVSETPIEHEKGFVFSKRSAEGIKNYLQSRGPTETRVSFHPTSLNSRSHRLLTEAIDKKHAKMEMKVKREAVKGDPEAEKREREEVENKRLQSERNATRKQDKAMRRASGGGGSFRRTGGRAGRPETTFVDYDDEEEEEEEEDELRRGSGGAAADARLAAAKTGGLKRPRAEEAEEDELFDDDDDAGAGKGRVYISDDDDD